MLGNHKKKEIMKTKFTKGKWFVCVSGSDQFYYVKSDISNTSCVATCYDQEFRTTNKAYFNAKLIAAAPETITRLNQSNEMLKSLNYLFGGKMSVIEKFGIIQQIKQNEEIIKKATE